MVRSWGSDAEQLQPRQASGQQLVADPPELRDLTMPVWHGSRTKIVRPRLPWDHVARARLIAVLDQSLARRATLVSAPAGFGKTTLLSAWSPAGRLVVWLSLDEGDTHLRFFVRALIHAIRSVVSGAGDVTLSLLSAANLPSPALLAARLANELAGLPDHLAIILDDYHVIHDDEVHAFVGHVVDRAPENVHLVIATRHDPPLALSMLRGRGELAELRHEHLAFTSGEAEAFIGAALPDGADADVAGRLAARSEGWAAGLRLGTIALSAASTSAIVPIDIHEQGERFAREFLIEGALESQSPDLQDLLLRSSILDRFSAPLLDACIIEPGAIYRGEEFLAGIRRANLFITALDADNVWFRYHRLFQEALHRLLRARSRPELLASLHRRASAWFAAQGMVEEAIRHALAAGEPGRAARLVEVNLHPLIDREEDPSRIEAWLQLLPEAVVNHDPAVLLARAWLARLRNRLADLPELLRGAELSLATDTSRDHAEREALHGSISTLWGYAWSLPSDSARMLASTEAAIQRVPRHWGLVRGHAEFLHATALSMRGNQDEARQFLAACRADAGPGDGPRLARLQFGEARLHYLDLRTRDLAGAASELTILAQTHQVTSASFDGHFLAGLASYISNRLVEAQGHFQSGIPGRLGPNMALSVDNDIGLALTWQALGDDALAQDVLRTMIDRISDIRAEGPLRLLQSCQVRLALNRGDDDEAGRQLRLLQNREAVAFPSLLEVPEITEARWLLHQGTEASLLQIDALAVRLRQSAAARRNALSRVRAEAVQALLLQARGDTKGALKMLRDVVSLTRAGSSVRVLVDFGTPMQQLLGEMMRLASQPDPYLAGVLAAFPGTVGPLAQATPSRPTMEVPAVNMLTRREQEVLVLLARRLSINEIASGLNIAVWTVREHTKNIYQKLQVRSRDEMVGCARTRGLLPAGQPPSSP